MCLIFRRFGRLTIPFRKTGLAPDRGDYCQFLELAGFCRRGSGSPAVMHLLMTDQGSFALLTNSGKRLDPRSRSIQRRPFRGIQVLDSFLMSFLGLITPFQQIAPLIALHEDILRRFWGGDKRKPGLHRRWCGLVEAAHANQEFEPPPMFRSDSNSSCRDPMLLYGTQRRELYATLSKRGVKCEFTVSRWW